MQKGNKNFSVFMVLGPPGSGKGTQIKMLAEKFGFFHFVSSKEGREYISLHNDPESLKQKERCDRGLLFDPQWMFKIVKEKTEKIINDKDNCNGIIYDGSPRTLYEAEKLYDFLVEKIGKENIKIIEIDVNEEELRNRIKKRLLLEKRIDDKEEVFETRIKVYKKETLPSLNFLKKKHGLIVVNGNQSVEAVREEIINKL